jgi:hypothetical protein
VKPDFSRDASGIAKPVRVRRRRQADRLAGIVPDEDLRDRRDPGNDRRHLGHNKPYAGPPRRLVIDRRIRHRDRRCG